MDLTSRQLYLRLLRHVAPYWRTFLLSIVALVILSATEPAIPALLKPLLDGSFVDKDLNAVNFIAFLLVLLFLVRGVAAYLGSLALAWVAGKLVMDLRNQMFDKLITLRTSYYDNHPSGSLISKVTYDVSQVTDAGTHVLTVLVRDTLGIAGLLVWMLYLDWTLTLVALATAPVIVFIVNRLSTRLRSQSRNLQRTMGEVTHVLEETINGQKVLRVFGAQDYEQQRFAKKVNWARRYQLKFASAAAANAPAAQFITAIALAVIVYLAAHKSAADEITIGSFVSFFTAMAMLFSPLKRLTGVNGPLQRGLAAAESVFKLVDEPSEPDTGIRKMDHAQGRLAFHDVTFVYDGKAHPALRGISVTVEPGETLALVGPSGSGKTTLVNLVPRFYCPTEGRIYLDGIDIETLTLASLRRHIALVSQDIILFNDTVAANIAYGRQGDVSEGAITEAAEAAHAMEFIQSLPNGLDTLIGENGVQLSGGQRQRLAIARAFLKNAPILIMDEATSSLDTASERHIQAALESLRRGRTTIVIAHRLSTIENADRIVVMNGGRIVETGTHTSLLEKNTLYAGLYRFQFSRQAVKAPAAGAN